MRVPFRAATANRDIVVAASAGAFEALQQLVSPLAPRLAAS